MPVNHGVNAMVNLKLVTRRSQRKNCRLFGKVRHFGKEVNARILNLSESGIAVELQETLSAGSGSSVQIIAEDLGTLHGVVRWSHNGRLGIQFDPNTNSRAQVTSYFRFFHRESRPVLGSAHR